MWHDFKSLNALTHSLVSLVLLSWLAVGVWFFIHQPLFNIKTIVVQADKDHHSNQNDQGMVALQQVNPLTIRSFVLPALQSHPRLRQGNFFTMNLDDVRHVFESVPWVRRATVSRAWPDTLRVSIEEYQPLATWGDEGQLLSTQGDLFTANLDEAEEGGALLKLAGPKGSEHEVFARLREMQQVLAPLKLSPEALVLSKRYAWTVTLNNGITVLLGREQNEQPDLVRHRIARFVEVYTQLQSHWPNNVVTVDMRYPNGLALRLKDAKI